MSSSSSTSLRSFYIVCLALLVSNAALGEAAARNNNNLRQSQHNLHQQQHRRKEVQTGSAKTSFITASHQSQSCIDQWHISIEHPAACTNSIIFPIEWADASVRNFIFHNSPEACCKDVKSVTGSCSIYNSCNAADNYYNGAQVETSDEYFDRVVTCERDTWHMSTEVLYACTNDDNYPDAWHDLTLTGGRQYLYGSPSRCCEESYPYQQCDVIDTCPTPPPTVSSCAYYQTIHINVFVVHSMHVCFFFPETTNIKANQGATYTKTCTNIEAYTRASRTNLASNYYSRMVC